MKVKLFDSYIDLKEVACVMGLEYVPNVEKLNGGTKTCYVVFVQLKGASILTKIIKEEPRLIIDELKTFREKIQKEYDDFLTKWENL